MWIGLKTNFFYQYAKIWQDPFLNFNNSRCMVVTSESFDCIFLRSVESLFILVVSRHTQGTFNGCEVGSLVCIREIHTTKAALSPNHEMRPPMCYLKRNQFSPATQFWVYLAMKTIEQSFRCLDMLSLQLFWGRELTRNSMIRCQNVSNLCQN